MRVASYRRFSIVLVVLGVVASLYGRQDPQHGSEKKTAIPEPLSGYLQLSDQQSAALSGAVEKHNDLVESKRADQRSARMRAASDPSVNASRMIEQDQLEIEKSRTETRQCITQILSADQLSRLEELHKVQTQSEEQTKAAEEAAALGLVESRSTTGKQMFGGTAAIFAGDTASQPDIDQPAAAKKPRSKRPPPTSPPQ